MYTKEVVGSIFIGIGVGAAMILFTLLFIIAVWAVFPIVKYYLDKWCNYWGLY